MKGVFNLRLPLPKYTFIWDVNTVLGYLAHLFPLQSLSLREITLKCVALFALCTAQRAQTLIALDLKYLKCCNNVAVFEVIELLKTSRPKHHGQKVVIHPYHRKEICPVYTLKHYVLKTKGLRKSSKLFISFKTFKKITTSTIARWLRIVLQDSGIDTSVFKGHSYRSASTSAASRAGLSLDTIIKTANWSSAKTFEKYYHKTLQANLDENYTNRVFNDVSNCL